MTSEKVSKTDIINELHKPARRNYLRSTIITLGVDDLQQADLVEIDSGNLKGISKINKGYKYLLTVIDTFSKFAWAIPVKNKTGKNVSKAMSVCFKNLSHHKLPKNLQTDNGKEFYNKDFQKLMKENEINHYSTYSNKKAATVERFNRSLKELTWKQCSVQGNYKWVDILSNLINIYNNRKHRTIGMTPSETSERFSLKGASEGQSKCV